MFGARRNTKRCSDRLRHGVIVVLAALMMVSFIILAAMAIDLGYIVLMRTEIQAAVDAAALAGAGELVNGTSPATTQVLTHLNANRVGGRTLTASDAFIEFGRWDPNTSTFTVTSQEPNGVRVTATLSQQPFFLARSFGQNAFNISAKAVAIYQPRDIVLVLDYSGSMCFDSQLCNLDLLGRIAVEANLLLIYQQLGTPTYGLLTYLPVNYGSASTSNNSVKSRFGLTNVPYPYPDGSWDEYIDYVQTDSQINAAGYRCDYGYLTWVNYVMAKHPSAVDSPGLWVTSQQPITALKDAVDVFLSFLTAKSTDDQVAFVLYSYSDNTARIEQSLTKSYTTVSTKVRQRQAGHYVGGTNISGGMTKGRIELQNNARVNAKKLIVLITDGVVNLPTGHSSTDKAAVISEANLCANARIPIVTIALGAEADADLMQQVADISGGACFVVPGGQSISQVQTQLEEVFGQVASDRPLKLVQ